MPHFSFTVSLEQIPRFVFIVVFMLGFLFGFKLGAFSELWLFAVSRAMRYTIRPVLEPRDMWIGAYWDNKKRILYLLPFPCVGIKIFFPFDKVCTQEDRHERA